MHIYFYNPNLGRISEVIIISRTYDYYRRVIKRTGAQMRSSYHIQPSILGSFLRVYKFCNENWSIKKLKCYYYSAFSV